MLSKGQKIYGLIGFPVKHSLSPLMHNAAFRALGINAEYKLFEVKPEELGAFLKTIPEKNISGLNVTIPHKEKVIPFLDNISEEAKLIGAVNTIKAFGVEFERIFKTSIETLGGAAISNETFENYWRKEENIEASQALDSELYQNERREKILAKIRDTASSTNFKSIVFPEEDYTQYLRAKSLVQGASRRLLDILRGALDMLDEDPRQEMGQLDLAAVIQAMASNKPATDVFFLEENLKQSFAWSIVFDASKSMNVKGEFTRALAIAVAEAAKEMMTDPTSWTFFAFNDRLYVIKASNESYSKTVRARIGGLKFDGLTFMPDAIQVAGKMLAKRFEEQRVLVVISDGWPYGYANMSISLKNTVEDLLKKGVIVIGIGVETDRMGNFFKLNASIHHPKDLIKKFGHTFVESSGKALDS